MLTKLVISMKTFQHIHINKKVFWKINFKINYKTHLPLYASHGGKRRALNQEVDFFFPMAFPFVFIFLYYLLNVKLRFVFFRHCIFTFDRLITQTRYILMDGQPSLVLHARICWLHTLKIWNRQSEGILLNRQGICLETLLA